MTAIELLLLALGLSMDSFAASVSGGVAMKRFSMVRALKIALTLAAFQAAMPVIGWIAGEHFKSLIESLDHWIAFALLGFLGGKMIWESLREGRAPKDTCSCPKAPEGDTAHSWSTRTTLCIALATSIDALAVGISFAFLNIRIVLATVIIFAVTLASSLSGIGMGLRFGLRLNRWAGLSGGIILVGIGVKILVEHLLSHGS